MDAGINVYPLSFGTVNWTMIQQILGDEKSMRLLQRQGVRPTDLAALPTVLKGGGSLGDHWSLRFVHLAVVAVVPDWDILPISLDQHRLLFKDNQAIIISGTCDVWRAQILSECKQDNNPVRIKVFNQCYDLICRTGLKSMFDGITRKPMRDFFVLH